MDFDKAKNNIDKWFDGKTQEEIQNIVDDMNEEYLKKSIEDSEDVLLLFAEWLQYNGKYQLPEQQVKSFLKDSI
jgi:serine protease inhibitor